MPRGPQDPSGPKTNVTVKLSPRHKILLDKIGAAHNLNRSQTVARLLERTKEAQEVEG